MNQDQQTRRYTNRTVGDGLGGSRDGLAGAPTAPGSCHVHETEPTELALELARKFAADEPITDFCEECGRRLAVASLYWSEWVARRVEKVTFRDDRTVNREISIDFLVREDAPVFHAPGGRRFWLVPVSIMRRKTLVNYYLRDEDGKSIPLPGLRLAQYLDESMLRAVALSELNEPLSEEAGEFIHEVIAGELGQVKARMKSLEKKRSAPDQMSLGKRPAPDQIKKLAAERHVFYILLHRLSYRYTLYAFIDADPRCRHRVLHMSVDEPLTLYHRESGLELATADQSPDGPSYELGEVVKWWNRHRLAAALGWTPTKVRFPVPAAENAASFHFEIQSPPGVDIVEASVLAGVPEKHTGVPEEHTGVPEEHTGVPEEDNGDAKRAQRPSFDYVRMRLPTVGLHVTAVPNGSSSRAQVHLQAATRGWYTTMLLSCWATLLLLGAILLFVAKKAIPANADVVVVLAGVAAAVATLIAQGEYAGMAGRLLALPRALAVAQAALPLIAATLWLLGGKGAPQRRQWELLILCVVAAVISITITIPWVEARWRFRKSPIMTSPWEMAPEIEPPEDTPETFWKTAEKHGYTTPAIRVDSAEAWHQHFRWTKEIQDHAQELLSGDDDAERSQP